MSATDGDCEKTSLPGIDRGIPHSASEIKSPTRSDELTGQHRKISEKSPATLLDLREDFIDRDFSKLAQEKSPNSFTVDSKSPHDTL